MASPLAWTLALTLLLSPLPPGEACATNETLRRFGDVTSIALPAGAACGSWMAADHPGVKELARSALATAAATHILKRVVRETRPNGGEFSFPSGHTSGAFSGAAYLHRRYGWRLGLPAEAAAAVVGWSRVDAHEHYWHDVVAGAALAHISAWLMVHPRDGRVRLMPWLSGAGRRGVGIRLAYDFAGRASRPFRVR